MAGASANVKIDDAELKLLFTRLLNQSDDLTDVFVGIGDELRDSTMQRFEDQVDPEGKAWEELSDLTKSRKATTRILIGDGEGTGEHLMDSLVFNASSEELIFGTNKIYGAMHQFGGTTSAQSMFPGKKIPARPFLGISASDEQDISALLVQQLLA